MVQAVISCFEKQYDNLYSSVTETKVNVNSDNYNWILFDVCHTLNCNLCNLNPTSNVEAYIVQLNAFKNVFDCYSGMKVFNVFTVDDLTKGFLIIHFDIKNFSSSSSNNNSMLEKE